MVEKKTGAAVISKQLGEAPVEPSICNRIGVKKLIGAVRQVDLMGKRECPSLATGCISLTAKAVILGVLEFAMCVPRYLSRKTSAQDGLSKSSPRAGSDQSAVVLLFDGVVGKNEESVVASAFPMKPKPRSQRSISGVLIGVLVLSANLADALIINRKIESVQKFRLN